MAHFKNISGEDLSIPNVGIVKAGEARFMPEGFHNANFEEIPADKPAQKKPDPINE
jgi:hypothetical protein